MDYIKYGASLLVLMAVGMLYEKYKGYIDDDEEIKHYELVRKYLLNDSSLAQSKRPIIWIHLNYEQNSRHWLSFGSRNSDDLNQPYLHLTIKSIIDKCGEDFNICLIDDDSFANILPGWNIDLHLVADPVKDKLRQLALAQVLHSFGGMLLPASFICFDNLNKVYNSKTKGDKMFVGEFADNNSTSVSHNFYPSTKIMGCEKNNKVMAEYIQFLQNIISQDYTDESNFLGCYGRWCNEKISTNEINLITADILGIKDRTNKVINVERLIGNSYIDLCSNVVGVYVPHDEILKRTSIQWFARLSAKQSLEADTNISKYLLTC
jgi:hypothetical protein